MINNKAMDNRNGMMGLYTKVIIYKEKNKEKEYLYGETIVHMKDNFMIIIFMEKGNMSGKMEESMRVNGQIIKCMVKVYLNGQMVGNIKVNIQMIKNMDSGHSNSKMADCIKDNGLRVSNMEEENFEKKIKWDKEYGKMVKGKNGLDKNKINQHKGLKALLKPALEWNLSFIWFK